MSALADFLRRNSVVATKSLPLVQTVPALTLVEVHGSGILSTQECDVFRHRDKGEQLNYFFVGRPAYKVPSDSEDAAEWELPCCFIFEFDSIPDIKRIYPFDTGAHHLHLYPNYINMMNMNDFEVSGVPDAPGRMIGAFFGNPDRYFRLVAKDKGKFDKEYSLTVKDPKVKALHRMASQTAGKGFDDRRFTIEVQSSAPIDLKIISPLAVVLPTVYLDDSDIRAQINEWGAEPLDYPIFNMSVESYYSMIYAKVYDFYKTRKFL